MGDQDFTVWYADYPSTHVKAGQSVQVITMTAAEQMAQERCAAALRALASDPAVVDRGVRALYESWRHHGDETTTPEDVQTTLRACLGIEEEGTG